MKTIRLFFDDWYYFYGRNGIGIHRGSKIGMIEAVGHAIATAKIRKFHIG